MTTHSMTIRSPHLSVLKEQLFPDSGHEWPAYILCSVSKAQMDPWHGFKHKKYLVKEVITIPNSDVVSSSRVNVTWRTSCFIDLLKRAESKNLIVGIAHSHPNNYSAFSPQDNLGESELFEMACNRNGASTEMLSIVITKNGGVFGRVWMRMERIECRDLFVIREAGSRLRFHFRNIEVTVDEFWERQLRLFGKELIHCLRSLRVGVAGCGGTGSAVAMLLARLGVGRLLLIDHDHVEATNLNRLHGSSVHDVRERTLKVHAVKGSITQMGFGTEVKTISEFVDSDACREPLLCCDVIFACTDDHMGRAYLNRFAYYNMVPVIDAGVKMEVSEQNEVLALDGRVTFLFPGSKCLFCHRIVNANIMRSEAIRRRSEEEYNMRRKEGYIAGNDDPSPSVVTFTTEVSCMAVNEMLQRMLEFRSIDGNVNHRVRFFNHDKDIRSDEETERQCEICKEEKCWGVGDSDQHMGRIKLQ